MLKIGEFSKLSLTTAKALRYYEKEILSRKLELFKQQRQDIDIRLSIISHILEDTQMKYQVTIKEIPETIVYYSETRLPEYSDIMQYIPAMGAECMKLNPDLKCSEPPYEFCEYLDDEHRDTDILIRHNEAVVSFGAENENIKFRRIGATKVLSIYHKGAYDGISEAYAYIIKYAEDNGFAVKDHARECYIDGIWNKESVDEWLTEIQLPIE